MPDPTLVPTPSGTDSRAPLATCPRCGRAAADGHACLPLTVRRDVVKDFIERLGFRPNDVCSLSVEPLEVDVVIYQREPEHGDRVRTRPGGHPVTQTVTLAVK